MELTRVGIIYPFEEIPKWSDPNAKNNQHSVFLFGITENLKDVSGRFLRKLPFLAHSNFVKKSKSNMKDYLKAIKLACEKELKEREKLE
jgi:hypothetical protein